MLFEGKSQIFNGEKQGNDKFLDRGGGRDGNTVN